MEMLVYTVARAKELGLGIDMTTGTGWPFGGPNISTKNSAKAMTLKEFKPTKSLTRSEIIKGIDNGTLVRISALTGNGNYVDITSSIQVNGDIKNLGSYKKVFDLDKKGVEWKNFNEINFVNIKYEKYDASNKKPVESGLLDKVKLIPLNKIEFRNE